MNSPSNGGMHGHGRPPIGTLAQIDFIFAPMYRITAQINLSLAQLPWKNIIKLRVGISQNIYTSGFFRTQKFTPKVRDLRQIQCYQKGVIRDKLNAKKNKKHPLC